MNPAILAILGTVIDKIFPDKNASDQAKLKLLELQQSGELAKLEAEKELAQGQIEVNKIEAASDNLFKSGWRPFIGWTCGASLTYQFLLRPLLEWVSPLLGLGVPPTLETDSIIALTLSLLGMGAIRMNEKLKGVA